MLTQLPERNRKGPWRKKRTKSPAHPPLSLNYAVIAISGRLSLSRRLYARLALKKSKTRTQIPASSSWRSFRIRARILRNRRLFAKRKNSSKRVNISRKANKKLINR